jgi:hypothetical protein
MLPSHRISDVELVLIHTHLTQKPMSGTDEGIHVMLVISLWQGRFSVKAHIFFVTQQSFVAESTRDHRARDQDHSHRLDPIFCDTIRYIFPKAQVCFWLWFWAILNSFLLVRGNTHYIGRNQSSQSDVVEVHTICVTDKR